MIGRSDSCSLGISSRVTLSRCVDVLQDQQRLLSQYQALVVKQLVSHSRKLPQGEMEADSEGPHGDDTDTVRKELLSLTNEVKDLVLSPRKTSVTED